MSKGGIFFVAAEASGDLLAREVIDAIRLTRPETMIAGIGGAEMAAAGIVSPIDVSALSILGFVEGLRAYGDVLRLADEAAEAILRAEPRIVVLVDSWGFMLRLARRIRSRSPGIRLVKLIGPQVWATRPGRARTLAGCVDHLLCMHEIELPYYSPFGLRTSVIGNPGLARGGAGNRAAFRAKYGLGPEDKAVLILPGSRRAELQAVAPVLLRAGERIRAGIGHVRLFAAPAQSVCEQFSQMNAGPDSQITVLADPDARFDAMAGADLVLACSGTVTSEVAMQGTPMIVAYKTGWITWALARGLLYRRKHITLLNILNEDRQVVPEFVQTRLQSGLIARQAMAWLSQPACLEAQRSRQVEAAARLAKPGPSPAERAASAILEELERTRPCPDTGGAGSGDPNAP